MSELFLSLLGLWVLLGAIWLAVWPLLARPAVALAEADVERSELEAEKGRLLAEIHELELDYATGKLSDEDYRAIEARLKGRAVEVLRRIDALRPADSASRRGGRRRAEPGAAVPERSTAGRTSG